MAAGSILRAAFLRQVGYRISGVFCDNAPARPGASRRLIGLDDDRAIPGRRVENDQ